MNFNSIEYYYFFNEMYTQHKKSKESKKNKKKNK